MELNFDKEMDALLRQAARSGETVSTTAQSHLDADEISAFAENALPEKTRANYIKHFASCDRCRLILSNTILLNAEAAAETAPSAVPAAAPETVETSVPWYRRLFLMPNLAYTMGALVLAVGGMLGFLVFQNATGSFDMAKSSANRSAANAPAAAQDEQAAPMSASNAATASNTANAAANTNVSSAANSAANANSSLLNVPADTAPTPSLSPELARIESEDRKRDDKTQSKTAEGSTGFQVDGASTSGNSVVVDGQETRSVTALKPAAKNEKKAEMAEEKPAVTADSVAEQARPSAAAPPPAKDDSRSNALSKARRSAEREAATKQIGGKTFNRTGGVWIDSEYNRSSGSNLGLPRTRTIRRGSEEYRKLDRQVRIIAESLAGPVIIVWKDGAYRIQ